MIRNNAILFGLNQSGGGGYMPSLQVSYGGGYAPLSISGIDEDGAIYTTFVIDVADATQVWDYVEGESWITVTHASKLGDDSDIRVFIEAQPSGAQPPRSGTLTFTSTDCANKVVTFNQSARAG